jgi:O-antigen/teichoic acid export membrane protein
MKKNSSILKNASFLFTAHISGRILTFILTVILPRYLKGGFDDLGKYFFALWFTNLLSSLTEFGLHTPLIRDVASDKSKTNLMISNAFVIRIILCIITFLFYVIIALWRYPGDVGKLICIIGLSEVINAIAQLFRCLFRAYEDMGYEALGVIVERAVVFLIGICAVLLGYGIVTFGFIILIASVINLLLTSLIMTLKFAKINLNLFNIGFSVDLLKKSLPYALGGMLYMAYFRVDGILLKNILGDGGNLAMGWYGTGYSFVNALTIIPGAFMGAVFPVISRAGESLGSLYTKSLKLMFIIGFPIAIGITFLTDQIVLILYPLAHFGLADRDALSIILKVLIWSGLLLFLNTVIITLYRATDARKAFAIITAISLGTNVVSNLILIPKYSYLGASISMIISESVYLVLGIVHIQKYICKINEFGFLAKMIPASIGLVIILLAFKQFFLVNQYIHIILTVIAGFAVYSAIIFMTRAINAEDIAMIRHQQKIQD